MALKNKFMITITDLNGSKNYLLSNLIKKFIVYLIIFVVFVSCLGIFYVNFLLNSTQNAKNELEKLNAEHKTLLEMKQANEQFLASLESKFSEEYGIDFNASVENNSLVDTIKNMVLSGAEENLLFSGIPNGDPTAGAGHITDKFGNRMHPILHRTIFHAGLDFGANYGAPIVATADGVVQAVGMQSGYGHVVEIRHNYGFGTRYGHLNGKYNVKVGDFVKKGDVIAYAGNSGMSTGVHLHYEVRFIQKPVDPIHFVNWKKESYKEIFEKVGQVNWQSLIKLIAAQNTAQ